MAKTKRSPWCAFCGKREAIYCLPCHLDNNKKIAKLPQREGDIRLTDRELSFFVGTQGYAGNGKFTSPSETDKGRFVSGASLLQKLCNEYDRRMAVGKNQKKEVKYEEEWATATANMVKVEVG